MPLSERRKRQCIAIINKLRKRGITSIFAEPVDPDFDNCPDYLEVIDRPMDLGTVLHKLDSNSYDTFREFCADVQLIWQNAIDYNGPDTLFAYFAFQFRVWFEELIAGMSDDEVQDWVTRVSDLQQRISSLGEFSKLNAMTVAPDSNSRQVAGKRPPCQKRPALYQYSLEPVVCEVREPPPPPRRDPEEDARPVRVRTFSARKTAELAAAVEALEDEAHVLKVISIIRKCEPWIGITELSRVNFGDLSMETRSMIDDFIRSLDAEERRR
jgi:hypothetical protein